MLQEYHFTENTQFGSVFEQGNKKTKWKTYLKLVEKKSKAAAFVK